MWPAAVTHNLLPAQQQALWLTAFPVSSHAAQFPALNKVAEQEEEESSDDAETVCSDAASKSVTQTGHRHGPVMFIHAANVLRAAADVQLVDARQLSVPYTADDEEVDAQAATVSAFARPTLPPNRGRLLQVNRSLVTLLRLQVQGKFVRQEGGFCQV